MDKAIISGRCRGERELPSRWGSCETHDGLITTALLLAAGAGTRLQPLTDDCPKCLTEVCGIPILRRLLSCLVEEGFKRLVVIVGYRNAQIRDYLERHSSGLRIDFVDCRKYATTNNIYSLWLARQQIQEPFLLVESDLVFETWMLDDMLQPDKMAISRVLPWMNGTTVELGLEGRVTAFRMGGELCNNARQYKSVNLYSLSLHSWNKIEERLGRYVSAGRLGEYYEAVFAEMAADGTLCFDAVFFDADRWYEIDTQTDLDAAEILFTQCPSIVPPPLLITTPTAIRA